MINISLYNELLENKGISLSTINYGSSEIALAYADIGLGLEILKDNKVIILGGDILTQNSDGELVYAYQVWGSEYISLNWFFQKHSKSHDSSYIDSYILAKISIEQAKKIGDRLKNDIFIVLVI